MSAYNYVCCGVSSPQRLRTQNSVGSDFEALAVTHGIIQESVLGPKLF